MSIGNKLAVGVEVICLVLAVMINAAWGADGTPEGTYQGAIDIPGIMLEIRVHLSLDDSGSWSATIDVPAQGEQGLPLADVTCTEDGSVDFVLESPNGPAAFSGQFNPETQSISGDFAQNGLSFPFHLEDWDPATATAIARQRLEGLTEEVATMMGTLHTPGMAIGVVLDGAVLYTETLGYSDVENELPVTADTLFSIGSTAKAFTATAIGMLADEEIVDWDESVVTYVPGFKLQDPVATANMTLRDLCSQRSGLPRHELTWLNASITRENLFSALNWLEPSAGFRERFQYSNLNFVAAGVIAGRAAGTNWEELISERILGPLEMSNTVLSYEEMIAAHDYARGYRWEDCAEDGLPCYQQMAHTDLTAVAPAGSIHSNLNDMLKWVKFQLGDGTVNGEQLLTSGQMQNLHSPQVTVPGVHGQLPGIPMADYGLGWLVYPYRGHYCVEHEGFINGFSSTVCLFPDEGIGIVIMTNGRISPLPKVVAYGICDRLLEMDPAEGGAGLYELLAAINEADTESQAQARASTNLDEPDADPEIPALKLAEYCGVYSHPAYGEITVSIDDTGLSGMYRQHVMDFEPLEDGKFSVNCRFSREDSYFGMLIPASIEFQRDFASGGISLAIPFEPMVEPIIFEALGPVPT